MKFIKKAKRGFTLVELVVVIAVIAILAAVSVGAYFGITDSANKSKLESEARGILTNIQLIANGNDSNSYMDKEAVHIKEVDAFERKLNGMSGIDYEVTTEMPTSISKETVYFINTKEDQPSNAPNDTFGTYYRFGYYTPDVGGKCAVYTFATQEVKIADANFDVNEEEGGNEGGEAATPVESINVTGVGSSIELYVDKLSPQIFVTWEPQESQIEYRYDSSIISWDTSFIKGLKVGSTNFEILDKASGAVKHSIAVTVKENAVTGMRADSLCKTNYFEGETFDPTGLQLVLTYEIGDPVPVNMSEVTYDKTTLNVGDNVVCTYGEYTYTLELNVEAITLDRIECNITSVDTQYFDGDKFNTEGLEFTAIYNDVRANHTIPLNDLTKDLDLETGDTSVTFTYGTESVSISFPAVKAVVVESLSAVYNGGNPEYKVGDIVTINGWTVTATLNNGNTRTFTEMVEGLEIYPKEALTAEDTHINFSYKIGNQTPVYTENLPIHVINEQTYYFIDQSWWATAGATPYLKLYDADYNFVRVDGIGVKMNLVPNTLFPYTVSQIYTLDIDIQGAKYIQIFRADKDGKFINAKTEYVNIETMAGNAIVLTTNSTWNDQSGPAKVTIENYDENYYRQLHIVGLGNEANSWNHTDANKFNYDVATKTYTLSNVNLEYHDEFLLKEVHGDGTKDEFNKLIKFETIRNRLTDSTIAFSSGENDNIKIGHSAAGVYNITIDAEYNISFERIGENFDIELRGVFKGQDRWTTDPISYSSRDKNVFTFENVELQENDRFRVYACDYSGFDYGFKNVTVNPNDHFKAYNSAENPDIQLVKVDGTYNITVDIKEDSIEIEEITAEHVHRYSSKVTDPTCTADGYTTHTCTSCGDSYNDTPVEAHGHKYTSKVTAATCTTDGYTTHTCTICNHSYTDTPTTKLGHSFTGTNKKCIRCNEHDTSYTFFKANKWTSDGAKILAYFFDDNDNHYWVLMTDNDNDGIFEAKNEKGYDHVIFCRGSSSSGGWNSIYNQTSDIKSYKKGYLYTIGSNQWSGLPTVSSSSAWTA